MKCPTLQVFFLATEFFMETIFQVKVVKRQYFKKLAWSAGMHSCISINWVTDADEHGNGVSLCIVLSTIVKETE